ncbi:MAG: type II secretion system major pseudopilin GspG [Verrucomicrobiota bacterium]|jgi:general secretion pathway protein G
MKKRLNSRAGFTLLEILLVVIIIGMLVGVAVVRLGGKAKEAQITAARDQIHNYESALDLYELDNGFVPTSEQGLQALVARPGTSPVPNNWKGPYLKPSVIRKDYWGHDYLYKTPGQHNAGGYDLYSPGPDGIDGNEDDIGNWQ